MRGLTEEVKLEKEVALQEKTLTEKDHQILELKSLESETSIEDLGNLIGSVCPLYASLKLKNYIKPQSVTIDACTLQPMSILQVH